MSPLPECNIPKHVFTIYISIKILVHLLLIDTCNCTFCDLFVGDNGLRCFLSFAGNTIADQYQPPKTVYFRFDFKDFFLFTNFKSLHSPFDFFGLLYRWISSCGALIHVINRFFFVSKDMKLCKQSKY